MCCRIDTSSPVSRVIAGLYILLATFLIGFFAVQATLWIDRFLLGDSETEAMFRTVEQPPTPGPDVNKDGPVAIEYLYTEPTPEHFRAVFQVTNFGSDTVRFRQGENNCLLYYGWSPRTFVVGPAGCEIGSDHLAPFESTSIVVPLYFEYSHYLLSVHYFVESNDTEQQADLLVEHPHKERP